MLGRARLAGVGTACVIALAAFAAPARAAVFPAGFQERAYVGFANPTAMAYAPDGRIFVAEKRGNIKVINPGSTVPRLVLTIADHVNSQGDHGLLGIAVDKDFASNGFVYLYYVYETDPLQPGKNKTARLTRIKVNPDNTVAGAVAPETILLGSYPRQPCPAPNNLIDCIPADTSSHNGGAIRVDPFDGTIWLAVGDANYRYAEPNRFRPYDERSFAGKIVHVDRNGNGLPGHPFCPESVDLTQVCTKLYAKGFRNPFRMTLRAGGKGAVVGDVGEAKREEIDILKPGGNYGWPCYEGDIRFTSLQTTDRCRQEYAKEGTPQASIPPIYAYAPTPGAGASVIAGPQYSGTLYPPVYRNSIFFGDFVNGFIRRLVLDASDRVTAVHDFATGWTGVDLQELPTGELAYVELSGTVGILGFDTNNAQPVAGATADRISGPLPLTVNFDASTSTDADRDPLSYEWDFGDGSAPATGAKVSHTYTRAGRFDATVSVTDGRGGISTASVTVFPGDTAPVVQISTPADRALYRDGVPVALRGTATDAEDGALTGASLVWDVLLKHVTHDHPFTQASGEQAAFTPTTDHDADSYYLVTLTATDSQGLSTSRTVRVDPETVPLTISSEPPGAPIAYAGLDFTAPFTIQAAIGFRANVSTADSFTYEGATWYFSNWSDGGAQAHAFDVPDRPMSLTAVYVRDADPPETTITAGPTEYTALHEPTFEFTSDETGSRFECSIDFGPWRSCASPYKTPRLSKGWHGFAVRAIDRAGNVDPSPATRTFKVITN